MADEGRGSQDVARITEAFYMVDKSRARKEGGAGLGLALCQKIIELHGAVWRFRSEVGQAVSIRHVLGPGASEATRRPEYATAGSSAAKG